MPLEGAGLIRLSAGGLPAAAALENQPAAVDIEML
jgi:hypothetical protein